MKKLFLPLIFACSVLFLPNTSAAEPSWWGEYCNKENSTCVSINNVKVMRTGFGSFYALFTDAQEKELCNIVAAFESEESPVSGAMFYELTLSEDNNTLTISKFSGAEIEEEGGCTQALFGTYTRK